MAYRYGREGQRLSFTPGSRVLQRRHQVAVIMNDSVLVAASGKKVPEFVALGIQIFLRVLGGSNLAGHALGDPNAGSFQRRYLVWVIREQAHLLDIKRFQDLDGHQKFSLIRFKTQSFIGLDRIEAAVLQGIGLQLRHQSYAAPLLLFVDQDARPSFRNHGKSHFQLLTAIATQRSENIAR